MTFYVGRNDPPIESAAVDSLNPSRSTFRLHLPVTVRTLNFASTAPLLTPIPI